MIIPTPTKHGMHRIYETDKGVIWIGVCTNPQVYSNPGYYISGDNTATRYSSAKQAFIAAYKRLEV